MSNGALGRIGGAHTPVRIKNLSERMPDLNKVRSLSPEVIDVIPNPMRPIDDEVVKSIASSMSKIGLMTPITVRYHEDRPSADSTDSFELIAGRHRLAAAKSLDWERIDVVEIECSDTEARLWEISENLHRAELTKLQRDGQLAEWIRLTDEGSSQVAKNPKGGRPGAISAAARELGVSKDDAHRAVKVDSLSPEAKAAAVEHGLDDNRSALLEAASEKDPAAQVEKIVARAGKKDKAKPAPMIDDDDLVQAADFLVGADVPGSVATNRLIKKIAVFFNDIDPLVVSWEQNDPAAEAAYQLILAVSTFAQDLQRRAQKVHNKKSRADNKISNNYQKRFGGATGELDHARLSLMKASLESGIDQLADVKRAQKEYAEQKDREQEEFQRTPITAETEQDYTAMIKHRTLYEGACSLAWPMYFKYREEHPDLPPLTSDDLAYAGMWTSCAL